MRVVIGAVFAILYGLLTFYGLGPVLFADGTWMERLLTLAVVIVIYLALTAILLAILRKLK